MGQTFGHEVLGTVGQSISISADGHPEMKLVGVTVDWPNVAAQAVAPATYPDGIEVAVGEKALPLGTVLYKHTTGLYRAANDTTTLVAGETYVTLKTVKEEDAKSNHPEVLFGGQVWAERLRVDGAGQPTLADLLAACPRLHPVS